MAAVAVVVSVAVEEVSSLTVEVCELRRTRLLMNCQRIAGRGGFQQRDMGPPAQVLEMGKFIHSCEGEMVVESTNAKIPHFNAPIYLENKVGFPLVVHDRAVVSCDVAGD